MTTPLKLTSGEVKRLERNLRGKKPKKKNETNECESHVWRAQTTGFKYCPDCGKPLAGWGEEVRE